MVTYVVWDPVNAMGGHSQDSHSYKYLKDAEHEEPTWKGNHMTAGHFDSLGMLVGDLDKN
jgi:hypothetical protein